ncbi:MAG TPA: ABC transporter permease [Bacilli bacterium]|nr:ABC transporter permease [Bacilli bacterium]
MKKSFPLRKIIGQSYIWIVLLLMYLPILLLVFYSFSNTTLIGGHYVFSFNLYADLFQNKAIMIAIGNTLLIAIISAAVATLLGTLGAIGVFYSKSKFKKVINFATQIPIVNAEIVIAFSLTVMFVFLGTYIFKDDIFGFWTLLIGHVSLSLPFVYISVRPKLQQMDPSLYEAAIDLGATPRQALTKITVPEIAPGVFSGFLLSITLSLDDFIITSFTRGAGLLNGDSEIETLSTFIQAAIKKKNIPPEMRALTTFIFIAVIIAVIAVTIYRSRHSNMKKIRKGRD